MAHGSTDWKEKEEQSEDSEHRAFSIVMQRRKGVVPQFG